VPRKSTISTEENKSNTKNAGNSSIWEIFEKRRLAENQVGESSEKIKADLIKTENVPTKENYSQSSYFYWQN